MANKLEEARKIINEVDSQMAELFLKRMKAAELVYEHKKELGLPILDEKRESEVIERGATLVEDEAEKLRAMKALMKTQTGKDFEFEPRWLDIVAVVRIDVTHYTAKHRPLPEKMR